MQIYRSWCYPHPWAELTELYVAPSFRQRGIGHALVSFLETVAGKAGASEIILYTHTQNAVAQSLYQSSGYRQQVECIFRKQLRK